MTKFKFLMTAAVAGTLAAAGAAQASTVIPCTDTVKCNFDGFAGGLKVYVPGRGKNVAFVDTTDTYGIHFDSAGKFKINPTTVFDSVLSFTSLSIAGKTISGIQIGTNYSFNIPLAGDYELLVKTRNTSRAQAQYSASFGFAAVPEPATWGMMIAGVGMAGGALRRRRSVRVAVA